MIARLAIDLAAIRANVATMRAAIAPAGYYAVVKADAYGHGLVPVARAIAAQVDGFCVYRADEAFALRAAGIERPILVLGPVERRELAALVASGIALALWDDGAFRDELARVARRANARAVVHVKIDTGVARLGLDPADAAGALARFLADPALDVRGAFTHLAAAEELESAFTLEQLARFDGALAPLDGTLAARGVARHAAASAAAMLFPKLRLDFVRAGIATYGIWPSEGTRRAAGDRIALAPALAWTTRCVVVRNVAAGRSVGYGCAFVTARPSRIAVLPIGYAEGLPRALSGRGRALVAGTCVPFVGRICMNMSFLDVTDAPLAHVGSTVTLVGRDGTLERSANDLALDAETIGYELVARLPPGIPRDYADAGARSVTDAPNASASPRSSVPS